jgi:sugar phosphate isomerase/epimerase
MRLGRSGAHLTYCTNIHPGETWPEVRANLETHVAAVKQRVYPGGLFGVGLRLGGAAAEGLDRPEALAGLQELLARQGMYVFTINAFPYGTFHRAVVKEEVYRPDWLEPERLQYSDRVAGLLDRLLPRRPGDARPPSGSVSTVPGCFRARAAPGAAARIGEQLARHAATLLRIEESGGAHIRLALEPEPECLFETTAQGVAFLQEQVFSASGRAAFAAATGIAGGRAEEALRRYVGLCLDACHAAVEFEDPAEAVAGPNAAGVGIFKLQVSAGLRVPKPDAARRKALEPFAEGVYLHQVVSKSDGGLLRVVDLPLALAQAPTAPPADEWRVHFHVPIFREALGPFSSTQAFLAQLLAIQARAPFTEHLEVETYTWDVLPEEHRNEPVADAVARELRWTLDQLGETPT